MAEHTEWFDPNARCLKCRHDDVSTLYRPDSHDWVCRGHRPSGERSCCGDEHFDRTCRRCHFAWREEVRP